MSERNGDKARFQKNRKRRLRLRQRIQAFMAGLPKGTGAAKAKKSEAAAG
jgi:hypothetical protein